VTTPDPVKPPATETHMSLRRIGLEIVIGFIGVYAAFALNAYKERRDLVERRHQIKRALIAEIRPIVVLARSNGPQYLIYLQSFDSTVKAGHPMPRPFTESVGLTDHVWEATKQAGGLNLIDVPTFVELAQFYNWNSQMFAQYAQLRDFSLTEILPRLSTGAHAFYEPGTQILRPSFVVYRSALGRLSRMNLWLVNHGDSLLVRLAHDTL
jgi:hypothetical protein